jgi:hypothetical protein
MFRTCQKTLTHNHCPRISTYCQRPEGHEGKCAEEATEEDYKQKDVDARQSNK